MPVTRDNLTDALPAFIRLDPIFRALAGQLGDVAEAYQAACDDVIESLDLEQAVGVQLDKLGEIVQYERQGESDDRYRRLVQMQIQTILSSAGTTAVLLEIVRIWTGQAAPTYVEPPAGRAELQIGAILEDGLEDAGPLLTFLRRAKPGGVRLSLLEEDASALRLDYEPGDEVDAELGILDYLPGDTVAEAASIGYAEVV
jgi:hypothetical protein